jgi:hypothetical protein
MAKTFRYPLKNIDASDDYFLIQSYDYVPPGLNLGDTGSFAQKSSDDVGYKSSRGTVILPIPENIQDSNSASWGEGNMGPIETATMGMAIKGIQGGFGAAADAVKDVFDKSLNAATVGTTQKMIQTFFASQATKALTGGGDFNQALSRQTGAVFNSNTELLFNGVSLRPGFSFSFDMVPRSRKESDQIKDIIRFFKSESAAQKGAAAGEAAGLFLKSPSVFRLRYMSGGRSHPFLNQFKICALNGMSVNYTPMPHRFICR